MTTVQLPHAKGETSSRSQFSSKLRLLVANAQSYVASRQRAAVAYAHTLPTRAKIAAAQSTSRLGDALVDVAAKLHEATTEAKRQQWRRRIQTWRQQVRIEELMLSDAKTSSGGRVVVTGKGDAKAAHFVGNNGGRINLDRFYVGPKAVETIAEGTGVDAAAIVAKLGKAN